MARPGLLAKPSRNCRFLRKDPAAHRNVLEQRTLTIEVAARHTAKALALRPKWCVCHHLHHHALDAVIIRHADPGSDRAAVIEKTNGGVAPSPISSRGGTKIAQVIALLERPGGATLAELVAVTGWLPHTTRAALTGLRKRGYAVGIERPG